MASFRDYVQWMVEDWDTDEVQADLGRYRYALVREMKGRNGPESQDALEVLHGNIEDRNFWIQLNILMTIDLPK